MFSQTGALRGKQPLKTHHLEDVKQPLKVSERHHFGGAWRGKPPLKTHHLESIKQPLKDIIFGGASRGKQHLKTSLKDIILGALSRGKQLLKHII